MNHTQRVAKYLALALALFLSVVIFSGFAKAAWLGLRILYGWEDRSGREEYVSREYSYDDVEALSVENYVGELVIRSGSEFKVETYRVDADTVCENENGTLTIVQKSDWESWLGIFDESPRIVVTVPEGYELTRAEIENKAGSMTITGLSAEELTVRSGAGEVILEEISAGYFSLYTGAGKTTGDQVLSDETKIQGGAGELRFTDCRLGNLQLESGVGKTTISGEIPGSSTVRCGVGETSLQINGKREEYRLSVQSSIGSVKVNGEDYSESDWNEEDAMNKLDISGGVGQIRIDFED